MIGTSLRCADDRRRDFLASLTRGCCRCSGAVQLHNQALGFSMLGLAVPAPG